MSIKFSEYRKEIMDALKENIKSINDTDFFMAEGFIPISVYDNFNDLSTSLIPCVAIFSKKTGRMYTFALKVLLPDIEI